MENKTTKKIKLSLKNQIQAKRSMKLKEGRMGTTQRKGNEQT